MLRHGLFKARYLLLIFQQKGYKINEFSAWLIQNWKKVLLPFAHAAIFIVTFFSALFLANWITYSALTISLIIISIIWFGSISSYHQSREKKPLVLTGRMARLCVIYFILSVWIPVLGSAYAFFINPFIPYIYILIFSWVFADLMLPFFLILTALLIYPFEVANQYRYKVKARKKLRNMPGLKIVAITGSYGKTSTKFMIERILKERYRVCSTPGSYNTPMGICKVINHDLQASDQVLILEMGARYKGNIEELCQIARPDIAVITNIGMAHLESFGSAEAIAETKLSLLTHLKKNGAAILNGDDARLKKAPIPKEIQVLYTGVSSRDNHILAENTHYDQNGCSFMLQVNAGADVVLAEKESSEKMTISLLGEHQIQNSLLAIGVGLQMKLRLPTIKIGLSKVKPIPHRMELKQKNGILILDDAFNSNPEGAKNAVTVLTLFNTGKKYIVTPGMIELGDREEEENFRFGEWISGHPIDHIFLVGKERTKPIYSGLKKGNFSEDKITIVNTLFEANDELQGLLKEGDIILYENDLPDSYSE